MFVANKREYYRSLWFGLILLFQLEQRQPSPLLPLRRLALLRLALLALQKQQLRPDRAKTAAEWASEQAAAGCASVCAAGARRSNRRRLAARNQPRSLHNPSGCTLQRQRPADGRAPGGCRPAGWLCCSSQGTSTREPADLGPEETRSDLIKRKRGPGGPGPNQK